MHFLLTVCSIMGLLRHNPIINWGVSVLHYLFWLFLNDTYIFIKHLIIKLSSNYPDTSLRTPTNAGRKIQLELQELGPGAVNWSKWKRLKRSYQWGGKKLKKVWGPCIPSEESLRWDEQLCQWCR
jgi:hypothetical protein